MKYFYEEYNHEVQRWIQYKKETGYIDKSSDSNPVVDKFLSERNIIKWSGRLKRDKLRKEKTDEFTNDEEISIKWSKMIKRDKLRKEKAGNFSEEDIIPCLYRPFAKLLLCDSYIPIDVRGNLIYIFHNPIKKQSFDNTIIALNGNNKGFYCLVSSLTIDLHFTGDSQCLPLYRYDQDGNRIDNITDWGLKQFRQQYQDRKIKKQDIFHYVYGVLHNPAYRQKYELNLKREFPRIPFYQDFWQWAKWGEQLMDWHINYEAIEPYPLQRIDASDVNQPKAKLKADKETGSIILDEQTTLTGIPAIAWEYKLGNRSALEWVLDQYKEKKPKDPTIAEKFNTYKFADYKEQVIDLLQRVCTVSVRTMGVVREMEGAEENK